MIDHLNPYAAYKDSAVLWLGEVPEHWEIRRMKTLFRERDERSGDGSGLLLSLTRAVGIVPQSEASNRIASAEDLSKYKVCRPGDLVMNRMQAWSGMFALSSREGLVSPDYSVFGAIRTSDVKYFEHLLKTPILVDQFAQRSKGIGSGFNRLYTPDFGAVPVVVPPLPEQSAIVRFLDHANRRIERYIRAKRKLIALLNEQKQAIIHWAVTRGLDPNIRLKPSGIPWLGEIPEHWELVPLKRICFIQTGVTLGKNYFGTNLVEYPYLRVANVQAGRLDLNIVKTLKLPENEARRSLLLPGDVLMTEGGDPDKLGRGCVWEGEVSPCLYQNHIFAVRPVRQRLLPQFLAALLISSYAKEYFLRTAKQTTNLASTNKTTIGNLRILLPSITEQTRILQSLGSDTKPVNDAITRTEREIALIREYRTRLVADVVTGQFDVREAAAKLPDESVELEPFDDFEGPSEEQDISSDTSLDAESAETEL